MLPQYQSLHTQQQQLHSNLPGHVSGPPNASDHELSTNLSYRNSPTLNPQQTSTSQPFFHGSQHSISSSQGELLAEVGIKCSSAENSQQSAGSAPKHSQQPQQSFGMLPMPQDQLSFGKELQMQQAFGMMAAKPPKSFGLMPAHQLPHFGLMPMMQPPLGMMPTQPQSLGSIVTTQQEQSFEMKTKSFDSIPPPVNPFMILSQPLQSINQRGELKGVMRTTQESIVTVEQQFQPALCAMPMHQTHGMLPQHQISSLPQFGIPPRGNMPLAQQYMSLPTVSLLSNVVGKQQSESGAAHAVEQATNPLQKVRSLTEVLSAHKFDAQPSLGASNSEHQITLPVAQNLSAPPAVVTQLLSMPSAQDQSMSNAQQLSNTHLHGIPPPVQPIQSYLLPPPSLGTRPLMFFQQQPSLFFPSKSAEGSPSHNSFTNQLPSEADARHEGLTLPNILQRSSSSQGAIDMGVVVTTAMEQSPRKTIANEIQTSAPVESSQTSSQVSVVADVNQQSAAFVSSSSSSTDIQTSSGVTTEQEASSLHELLLRCIFEHFNLTLQPLD